MSKSTRNLATVALALAVLGATVGAHAAVLINETFEGLTTSSPLVGQDGWAGWFPQSGQVAAGTGVNTSTIISTPAASADNTGNVKTYGNFGLTSGDRVALEFLVQAGPGSRDTALFALGNQSSSSNPGPLMGVFFGHFEIREDNWGPQHVAKTTSGSDFKPVAGTWYRVYSEWDLGAKTSNMLIKDLSDTDPNVSNDYFQQLYFNTAQTQATASLGALANLSGWERARIRLGGDSGGIGNIDNLRVSTLETLADYQFYRADPAVPSTMILSSSDTEPTSTASDFGKGPGVSLGSTAWGTPPQGGMLGGFAAADEAAAISANDYVTFSITPGAAAPLNLASLQLDLNRRYSYVPSNYSLFADEDPGAGGDNFGTLLASGYIGDAVNSSTHWNTHTFVLSDTSFLQGISDTTTFRLYLYGSTGTSGQQDWSSLRIDSVLLRGQVVPEPGTLLLLTVAGLGLLVTRRRRKR